MHSTAESRKSLAHQHAHRVPDPNTQATLKSLRQAFLDVAALVDSLLPPGRERSLAQTRIDEARMWACNAATMHCDVKEPLDPHTLHPL